MRAAIFAARVESVLASEVRLMAVASCDSAAESIACMLAMPTSYSCIRPSLKQPGHASYIGLLPKR